MATSKRFLLAEQRFIFSRIIANDNQSVSRQTFMGFDESPHGESPTSLSDSINKLSPAPLPESTDKQNQGMGTTCRIC
jgi:hypothetical protein